MRTNTAKKATRNITVAVDNTEVSMKAKLYNLIIANAIPVGNRKYAEIPLTDDILYIDDRIQRDMDTPKAKTKIRRLAENWNPNKMDALKVVPHPEEFRFSTVDGGHRLCAGQLRGEETLICEIILGLSDNPEERLIQEATLFATQNDEVDSLSPVERHKANVLRGIRENVILNDIIEKYGVVLKTNPSHGRVQMGQLGGFTMALNIAKHEDKDVLDEIFYILHESRWNIANNGLSANIIHAVYNILRLHPQHKDKIKGMLIDLFTPIEPDQLFSQAYAKYPDRKEKERNLLYLEDVVCKKLKINRVYNGGNVSRYVK